MWDAIVHTNMYVMPVLEIEGETQKMTFVEVIPENYNVL